MGRGPEELGLYKVFRDIGDKGRWFLSDVGTLGNRCHQLVSQTRAWACNWKEVILDHQQAPMRFDRQECHHSPRLHTTPQLIWKDIRIGQVLH